MASPRTLTVDVETRLRLIPRWLIWLAVTLAAGALADIAVAVLMIMEACNGNT